jgi:2-dehydro-3-deoxyphosphogluconate aldolase/(4S)-4-hydroxy-2-oxoglutarate aldolase
MTGTVLDRLAAQRIVPVIRAADPADAVATARACAAAGLDVVELTCTTPRVGEALHALRDDGLCVGLGTITAAAEVDVAVAGGAAFVVSFTNPTNMVAAAHAAGLTAIPGALTPSEVAACRVAGADAVKLFPARVLTPGYLSDLRAVLPDLRAVVTGGLRARAEDLHGWLDAGALALGLGGELGSAAADGAPEVTRRAAAALAIARAAATPGAAPPASA